MRCGNGRHGLTAPHPSTTFESVCSFPFPIFSLPDRLRVHRSVVFRIVLGVLVVASLAVAPTRGQDRPVKGVVWSPPPSVERAARDLAHQLVEHVRRAEKRLHRVFDLYTFMILISRLFGIPRSELCAPRE